MKFKHKVNRVKNTKSVNKNKLIYKTSGEIYKTMDNVIVCRLRPKNMTK